MAGSWRLLDGMVGRGRRCGPRTSRSSRAAGRRDSRRAAGQGGVAIIRPLRYVRPARAAALMLLACRIGRSDSNISPSFLTFFSLGLIISIPL